MKTITYALDDFIYQLYPDVPEGDMLALMAAINAFFVEARRVPKFDFAEDSVTLELLGEYPDIEKERFDKLMPLMLEDKPGLCIPILNELKDEAPWDIRTYLMLGMLYGELGKHDVCIETVNDGLKWNPNLVALYLLGGDAYALGKKDYETALKYYRKANKLEPNNYDVLSQFSVCLLNRNRLEEAYPYIQKMIDKDPRNPRGYKTMGLYFEKKKDYKNCSLNFIEALRSVQASYDEDPDYDIILSKALKSAEIYSDDTDWTKYVDPIKEEISAKLGTDVRFEYYSSDANDVTLELERAVPHGRDYHLICLLDTAYPKYYSMILQLVHLELSEAAVAESAYRVFSFPEKRLFKAIETYQKFIAKRMKGKNEEKFSRQFYSAMKIMKYLITETPLKIFIHEIMFERYRAFRPYMFLTIFDSMQVVIDQMADAGFSKNVPAEVQKIIRIYFLVQAEHFKKLFGVDRSSEIPYRETEFIKAMAWFDEAIDLVQKREPGEEFDLIEYWAKDVKMYRYLEIREVQA